MLPFLKPKKLASVIIAKTKPEGGIDQDTQVEGEPNSSLMKAAEDAIGGFHAKDAKAVVDAMTRMHSLLNNPHESEDT